MVIPSVCLLLHLEHSLAPRRGSKNMCRIQPRTRSTGSYSLQLKSHCLVVVLGSCCFLVRIRENKGVTWRIRNHFHLIINVIGYYLSSGRVIKRCSQHDTTHLCSRPLAQRSGPVLGQSQVPSLDGSWHTALFYSPAGVSAGKTVRKCGRTQRKGSCTNASFCSFVPSSNSHVTISRWNWEGTRE